MTLKEAIVARHSVRAYTQQPIEEEKLCVLRDMIEEINTRTGLHFQLVTNEPKAFSSRLAHYGKFRDACNYIALVGKPEKNFQERIGYEGERLVLEAQRMGLNTCWAALTFKKKVMPITLFEGERLGCVISIGYGTTQGAGHKVKRFEDVARCKGAVPEWFREGVEAALLAPTAVNQQRFRLMLTDDNTIEAKALLGFYSKIDLGIVRLHFEIGAGTENFRWKTSL